MRVMTVGDIAVGEAKTTAQEGQVLVDDYQEDTPHLLSMLLLIVRSYTLIRESAAKRMGSKINNRRNTPSLQGVTGSPLRVLGMIWLEIGVEETKVYKQWFPVVPDHYLSEDLLLDCDVLCQAPLSWYCSKNVMLWGSAPYTVHNVKRQKCKVKRVQSAPSVGRALHSLN